MPVVLAYAKSIKKPKAATKETMASNAFLFIEKKIRLFGAVLYAVNSSMKTS
jgi:hypothetical protein